MVIRTQSLPNLGASADYRQIEARTTAAHTWGTHTFIGQVNVGLTTGGFSPLESRFAMGGLFSMPGYNIDSLVGQHLAHASITYMHAPGRYGLLPVYFGAAMHAGNVWESRPSISAGRLLQGRSVFAGTDTLIGPVYFGFGTSPGASNAVYLNLGQPAF